MIFTTRRQFLISSAAASVFVPACVHSESGKTPSFPDASSGSIGEARPLLEDRLANIMRDNRLPGLSAALIEKGQLAWARGFGFADIDIKRPMTPLTLLNFGSVTKTVTATAALQLVENRKIGLDDDVNDYLDFFVRNPRFPDTPITLRQLLAHRSSIKDSQAYGDSYRCGDPVISLHDFLASYVAADAPDDHFHIWEPGSEPPSDGPRAYSNVAFGLIGVVIESVSGEAFADYCQNHIFSPLNMDKSTFSLSKIERENHVTPYAALPVDFNPSEIEGKFLELSLYTPKERPVVPGEHWPFCLYSFATPPDGLLRTSVTDIAKFLMAWMPEGLADRAEVGILKPQTIRAALSTEGYGKPLTWYTRDTFAKQERALPGGSILTHTGGDPGVGTAIGFRPESRDGFIFAFNRGYGDPYTDLLHKALLTELVG